MIDVTNPVRPRPVPNAEVPLADAHGLYLARTYAYVAAGREGLAIIDIERPETPTLDQRYDAAGAIDDARDVKVGMTNASLFAYVADGKNGLRVLQLTSPEETPTYLGFSPRPQPRLIATAPHARSRPGHLQGHRSRPRGGRERSADRRVQPGREPAAHAARDAAALHARRRRVHW